MKNKRFLITLITCAIPFILSAQSVERAFISMPDEYYLSLPSAQRKEMVKAYKTDSTATRKNKFRGESSILLIDSINEFMSIKNSENAKVHLKVLKNTLSNINYFALIFTACAPICDSHIGFYDADWKFLQNSLMPKISIIDFLNSEKILADGKKVESVAEQFDVVFIESNFVEKGNDIEVTLNSEKYMDEESYTRLKKYLKGNKILYKWENNSFKKNICYW